MRVLSKFFIRLYGYWVSVGSKLFTILAAGAFAGFGKHTVLMLPVRLSGEARIQIGDGVYIGSGSWLQTLPDDNNESVAISIGSGTSIAGSCVISAIRQVILEDEVLFARNVYVSDHIHKYSRTDLPILNQGVDKVLPVLIKRGAWLGQNVVVCPGVTIGQGAVIGANSVVNRDIPDYCVAAGAPAKALKFIGGEILNRIEG